MIVALVQEGISHGATLEALAQLFGIPEVGAFYWTALAPDIVNPGREEQGSVSV